MENLEHIGTIVEIDHDELTVKIDNRSACHNCAAQAFCGLSECKSQLLKTKVSNPEDYHQGEQVMVAISLRQGMLALVWTYVVPLILILAAIIIGQSNGLDETTSGISSIIILISYYLWLFLTKNKFKNRISFKIIKKSGGRID